MINTCQGEYRAPSLHHTAFVLTRLHERNFVQHVPPVSSPTRQGTLDFIVPFFASAPISFSRVQAYTGMNHGFLYYRMDISGGWEAGGITFAGSNVLRFNGTCFVENFEVLQRVFGNETNPIAFF